MKTLFVCILTICSISSCGSIDDRSSNEDKFILFDNNGEKILTMSHQKNIKELRAIIRNKKLLLRKILPVFTHQLIFKVQTGEQVWLLARPNYIKEKSKNATRVFTLEIDKEKSDFFTFLSTRAD